MANLKKLKQQALQQTPAIKDITSVHSLKDNFVYSLLINSKFGHEIEGFSVVELSNFLKEKGVQNDYELFNMIFDQ